MSGFWNHQASVSPFPAHVLRQELDEKKMTGHITGHLIHWNRPNMNPAQLRAVRNYRTRIAEQGLARFEVLARSADKALIRKLARKLAENDAEAERIRTTLLQSINATHPPKGGILAALRASPLVGANINPGRERVSPRELDL
ncbi:MAG: hypothetical protein Q4D19_08815 [Lautropia sp.]|nr:hypothetical protein [Lautropia sp.]